jgi:hypothetical protein
MAARHICKTEKGKRKKKINKLFMPSQRRGSDVRATQQEEVEVEKEIVEEKNLRSIITKLIFYEQFVFVSKQPQPSLVSAIFRIAKSNVENFHFHPLNNISFLFFHSTTMSSVFFLFLLHLLCSGPALFAPQT